MPTIRQLIPPIDQDHDTLVKVQVWLSQNNKRRILSAVGDDGVFTFVIAHAFKRAAEFIEKHDIKSYDPESVALFTNFICNGTDSRVDRNTDDKHDAGAAKGVQHKDAATPRKPSGVGKSSQGRSRK